MRQPTLRPVYRAIHTPLTVGGKLTPPVERRLFFSAAMAGATVFYLVPSMLWGIVWGLVVFLLGYLLAVVARHDAQWLPSMIRSWRLWAVYDPGKHEPFEVVLCDSRD